MATGQERVGIFLLSSNPPPALPATFAVTEGAKFTYDFSDPFYRGGGPFGEIGQIEFTVLAYDAQVVAFEFVSVPDAPPPPLLASAAEGSLALSWGDPWSAYLPQKAESINGDWQPVTGTVESISGNRRLSLPVADGGFFRLVPRNRR